MEILSNNAEETGKIGLETWRDSQAPVAPLGFVVLEISWPSLHLFAFLVCVGLWGDSMTYLVL